MLSGLKTRSLGLNTLGTTQSPASSQSVQVGRPSTASWVQQVLSKVNVTCSRPQRNVHRPGFEPGTPWSEIRCPNHCATPPPLKVIEEQTVKNVSLVNKLLNQMFFRRSDKICMSLYIFQGIYFKPHANDQSRKSYSNHRVYRSC